MIQLVVFVPESHKELVKSAIFSAGGGRIGNYEDCCFEQSGLGQFRPMPGHQAFIGKTGELSQVSEIRLEVTCLEEFYPSIVAAMKVAHPYETPAYYGIKIVH